MTKKKTEKNDAFDFEQAIHDLEKSEMFKVGFVAYINDNNLKVTSKKDFEKKIKQFGELKL